MKKRTFLTSLAVLASSLIPEVNATTPRELAQSAETGKTPQDKISCDNPSQQTPFVLQHSDASENLFLAAHRSHSSHSSHSSHYSGSSSYSPPISTPHSYSPSYNAPSSTPTYRDSSSSPGTSLSSPSKVNESTFSQTQENDSKGDSSPANSMEDNIDKETIIQVQMALYKAGFGQAKFDGIIGASMAQALMDYQASKNLSKTGRITKETLDALGVKY